jgi:predicted SprT family Zn-dependent metalloprotease
MPSAELQSIADRMLNELCAAFPIGFRPAIVWKSFRVTAGMAYYKSRTIGLSEIVLRDEASLHDTLVHEYAHFLAVYRHGLRERAHGPGWRRAMHDLGAEPKVRHNYDVERNASHLQVTYECLRCGKNFNRRRRLPRGGHFVHARCGGELRLTQIRRVIPSGEPA